MYEDIRQQQEAVSAKTIFFNVLTSPHNKFTSPFFFRVKITLFNGEKLLNLEFNL